MVRTACGAFVFGAFLALQLLFVYLRLPGLSSVSVERFRADLDLSYTNVLTGDLSEEDARRVFHDHCFVTRHHDEKTEGMQYECTDTYCTLYCTLDTSAWHTLSAPRTHVLIGSLNVC